MADFELEVTEEDAGERVDVVLSRRVPNLSRAGAKALLAEGVARVDGRAVRKSHLLTLGDRVVVESLPSLADFHAAPDPAVQLEVLRETNEYVVVDKPSGVASHPLREGELGTLAGALVARYPEMRGVGYSKREPGLLHRLDIDTSGVVLAARSEEAFERLRAQLKAGEIEKRYLARVVGGVVAPQVIEARIANDPRDPRRVRVCTDPREIKRLGAKPAITEVLRSSPMANGSLVEVRANHARRHQIRAHLASIGHALLGDTLYGGPSVEGARHHLLHASAIVVDGETIRSSDWKYGDLDL